MSANDLVPPAGAHLFDVSPPAPPAQNLTSEQPTTDLGSGGDAALVGNTPPAMSPPAVAPHGSIVSALGEVYTPPTRPPIVTRQKPKYVRRKNGEPPKKPGPPPWIWGTKLKFFEARKEDWIKANEKNGAGDFYAKMAKLYIWKYGHNLEDGQDFEYDVADPPDWLADHVVNERLPAGESTRKQECYAKAKERLGQWYRAQFTSLLKEDKSAFGGLFAPLGNVMGQAPRKPQLMHFYSTRNYETRVKERAEARFQELVKEAELSGEPAPHMLAVRNEVTKACWQEESDVFKEETMQALERAHEITLRAWKEGQSDGPSRTAEEYNASLKTAAHYLQPFVDSIAERYGMCVSLLMAGPIGDRNGHIEMRSVHAGATRGLVPKDWPLHDPQGFTAVEASMVDFAHHVYSEADCEARKTGVQGPQGQGNAGAVPAPQTSNAAHSTTARPTAAAGVTAPANPTAPVGGEGGEGAARPDVNANGESEGGDGGARRGEEGADNGSENGDDGGGENGVDGAEGGAGSGGESDAIARLWIRKDRPKWTEELGRAFSAFERLKAFGDSEWAVCVDKFFEFEKRCGYGDGALITTENRPDIMRRWLARARKWEVQQDLGDLGAEGIEGSFIDEWWKWWNVIQPKERGALLRPTGLDWSLMTRLHGRNGLLQIMATLLWWGEAIESAMDRMTWTLAVEDVTWALEEMLMPGVIQKAGKE
ncbi:hypothetical protein R3P38DRAFT_3219441 [Favolaschia claudopus]|uniref:Uncharacterized protein n=1 Tax=Favolaschia claudopus TaxID=2862362 RepID=A0AAW0A2H1_9AGAR